MPLNAVARRTRPGTDSDAQPGPKRDAIRASACCAWRAHTSRGSDVYDRDGDKVRTVQFRAAGIITPSSLFFGKNGKVLVTPGPFFEDPFKWLDYHAISCEAHGVTVNAP